MHRFVSEIKHFHPTAVNVVYPTCDWFTQDEDYHGVVQFAVSLVDSQLFVHYLAVVLLELRHLQPCYSVCVIRSTDGETRQYNIGQLKYECALTVITSYLQTPDCRGYFI